MSSSLTLRRRRHHRTLQVALGMLVAGTALTAMPSIASATTSTCAYNTSNKNLIVTDNSGDRGLRVFRVGEQIRISDEPGTAGVFCPIPGQQPATATVHNTERIAIFRSAPNLRGGVTIDQYAGGPFRPGATPETDGQSEVEITIVDDPDSGFPFDKNLTVYGTPEYDSIMVGTRGRVNLGFDADVDIEPTVKPTMVIVDGREGNDDLWGTGVSAVSNTPPADIPLQITGFDGNDMLVGGADHDILFGGEGDDRLITVDTVPSTIGDGAFGDAGSDMANVDARDSTTGVEKRIVGFPVGQLKLSPRAQHADVGKPVRVKLSWTHPKAWKQLRTVKLRVSQGADAIGTITARPRNGNMRSHGAVKLIATDSKLTHRGKTVTARLAVRLNRSVAGQDLRVDVEATDGNGRTQLEPQAGVIHVAE